MTHYSVLRVLAGCLVALPVLAGSPHKAGVPHVEGRAHVVDGDTIRIHGTVIRLHVVDAPEIGQTCLSGVGIPYACGVGARLFLERLTEGHQVRCYRKAKDRYGRTVARCFIGERNVNGNDIGYVMLKAGWAVVDERYELEPADPTLYAAGVVLAKTNARGVWSGTFTEPWEWRRLHLKGDEH